MIPRCLILALALTVPAVPAAAECYADYKAKQENGRLKLHYGVAEVPDAACGNAAAAAAALAPRLAREGWTLLNILSTFGPGGLDSRRDNAGPFFLAF